MYNIILCDVLTFLTRRIVTIIPFLHDQLKANANAMATVSLLIWLAAVIICPR